MALQLYMQRDSGNAEYRLRAILVAMKHFFVQTPSHFRRQQNFIWWCTVCLLREYLNSGTKNIHHIDVNSYMYLANSIVFHFLHAFIKANDFISMQWFYKGPTSILYAIKFIKANIFNKELFWWLVSAIHVRWTITE